MPELINMFKCYLCQWMSESNDMIIKHMNEEHQLKMEREENVKLFCCVMCKYNCKNVAELKEHMVKEHQKNGWEWWRM